MRQTRRISFFSFVSASVLMTMSPNVLAQKKPTDDCCQDCRKKNSFCDTVTCNGYPPFIRSNCYTTCGAEFAQCSQNCSGGCEAPADIQIRNGSVYTINVFSNDKKTKLGTLTGWYTYPIVLQATDFPIYYTYCSDLTQDYCYTDSRFGEILNTPNCYVVWYFGRFYTTLWGMGCSGEQSRRLLKGKENVKSPSSPIPTPKHKETSLPGRQEKSSSPLTATPKSKDTKSPSEKKLVPQTKKEAPALKLPQAVEEKETQALDEKESISSIPPSFLEKKRNTKQR